MRKMRGFIEPMTLGFLISLIGSTTAYVYHNPDSHESADSATGTGSTLPPATEFAKSEVIKGEPQ